MKNLLLGLVLLLSASCLFSQTDYNVTCVGFYNLENLFDLVDDDTHNDDEFTPLGSNVYNQKVYDHKIESLSSVISEIGTELSPEGVSVLGVSEIENKSVVEDLINHDNLKDRNYRIIHYDSKDFRGIDVGLIYNPKYFLPTQSFIHSLVTRKSEEETRYSRDILFVIGKMDGERVCISVNHWPSRRGGEKATEHLRNKAAAVNARIIDSLQKENLIDKAIIMGDMNDDPTNASMCKILSAEGKKEKVKEEDMYNPYWKYYKKGYGTTAWRDAWGLFDQIVFSSNYVLGDSGYKFYQAKVFNKKYLVQQKGQYKGYPFRTYSWGNFQGGYSDHFPVYAFLIKEK